LKKILFLPIIAVLITVLSLLPQDAHAAVTIDLKDQASCQAAPLNGSWDATYTPTCSINGLALNVYYNLINSGTINNFGTIDPGTFNNNNGGIINNYGSIFNPTGILNNYGTIYNKASASITDPNAGCDYSCIINNYGTIDNSGLILDAAGKWGQLNNYATIVNEASGTLEIRNTATFNNTGTINNQGTISNEVSSIINNSGAINNSGTINNYGPNGYPASTINNTGTITNLCGGTINNSGTMSGNPVVNNCLPTTTTTLTSSLNPSTFGQSVTFTATVSPSTAPGTVQFSIDGTPTGSPITLSNSQASYSTSSLSAGTHQITAAYSGDTNDAASTSSTLTQTVNKVTSTTTVSPNPSFMALTSTKTFHITVTDTSSSPTTPTGTVSWSDGGAGGKFSSASCTLVSSSSSASTCSIVYSSPSKTGPVTITATYSGDSKHAASSGTSALTVTLRHTSTVVTPNPSSVVHGNPITYTATITDTSSGTKSAPTGTASWKASVTGGTFSSGTCTLAPISSSQSSCQVTYNAPTTAGTVTITGTYGGDSTHAKGSGKATLTVT
jgi:hypothetical protein